MVDLDAGVGQQFLLHRSVHRGHAIWGRAPHADVILEREEPFFRPLSSLDCNQRIVLAKNKKCRHKGVSLLASLSLQNLMNNAITVLPQISGWRARELQNEWQNGLSALHVSQCAQHGISRNGVVRADSIR